MAVNTNIYDERFFANTIKFESESARAVADILIKQFKPNSVIDIGCGVGIYLKEFASRNVEILGYDGAPAAIKQSLAGGKIKLHDLCQPLKLEKKFDLCLCIEVAEHLPEKCADTLIKTLVNLSDVIIFTAAAPGQGPRSMGHINEQEHMYWIDKFKDSDFDHYKELSNDLSKKMIEKKVVWWITKNLMIFKKSFPSRRISPGLKISY